MKMCNILICSSSLFIVLERYYAKAMLYISLQGINNNMDDMLNKQQEQ